MNMVVGIIPLILLILVVTFCVRTFRRALSAPGKHDAAAKCGKCGYEIADLSFDRCPECGGKLLEVGIVTPALIVRRESSVAGLIGAWTLAIGLTAIISFGVVGMFWSISNANLTRGANTNLQQTHNYRPTRQSQSQDYRLTVELDVITNSYVKVRTGTIGFVITHSDQTIGSLKLDAVTLEILSEDGSQVKGLAHTFSINDAIGAYESAGLDINDEKIIYEADQLVDIITEAAALPFGTPVPSGRVNLNASRGLKHTGGGSSQSSAPPAPILAGLNRNNLLLLIGGGFWLTIYIVGLRLMLLGRKRALQGTD